MNRPVNLLGSCPKPIAISAIVSPRSPRRQGKSRPPPNRDSTNRRLHDYGPGVSHRHASASQRPRPAPLSPYTPASRRLLHGGLQRLGLVGLLPAERRQLAAEVAVARRLAVDRPPQVQRLDDPRRRQLE